MADKVFKGEGFEDLRALQDLPGSLVTHDDLMEIRGPLMQVKRGHSRRPVYTKFHISCEVDKYQIQYRFYAINMFSTH